MVGGRKNTATTEKILIITFCSTLIKPRVASSRKVILSDKKAHWALSACVSEIASSIAAAVVASVLATCFRKTNRRLILCKLSLICEFRSAAAPSFLMADFKNWLDFLTRLSRTFTPNTSCDTSSNDDTTSSELKATRLTISSNNPVNKWADVWNFSWGRKSLAEKFLKDVGVMSCTVSMNCLPKINVTADVLG